MFVIQKPDMRMRWTQHFLLQSAGVSQWQSLAPSVPPAGPPPCGFHQTGGCVCFGRHESTKRGGPSFYPCFDPSIERTQAWPSLSVPPACACLDGWPDGWDWGLASPALCTWHSSRMSLLTRQQIGFECTWWLSPASPDWSPFSLSFNQPKTAPASPCF